MDAVRSQAGRTQIPVAGEFDLSEALLSSCEGHYHIPRLPCGTCRLTHLKKRAQQAPENSFTCRHLRWGPGSINTWRAVP